MVTNRPHLIYFQSETTLPLPADLGPEFKLEQPDPKWHGDSGPIVKAYSTHFASLHVPFIDALEKLNVPKNSEPVSAGGAQRCSMLLIATTSCHSEQGQQYRSNNDLLL